MSKIVFARAFGQFSEKILDIFGHFWSFVVIQFFWAVQPFALNLLLAHMDASGSVSRLE